MNHIKPMTSISNIKFEDKSKAEELKKQESNDHIDLEQYPAIKDFLGKYFDEGWEDLEIFDSWQDLVVSNLIAFKARGTQHELFSSFKYLANEVEALINHNYSDNALKKYVKSLRIDFEVDNFLSLLKLMQETLAS